MKSRVTMMICRLITATMASTVGADTLLDADYSSMAGVRVDRGASSFDFLLGGEVPNCWRMCRIDAREARSELVEIFVLRSGGRVGYAGLIM